MESPVPRSQSIRLFFSLTVFLLVTFASAFAAEPTITVVSPTPGATVGSPVYFEAYAYSATCASGISAMRIYSSPGVIAGTASSNHISRFVPYGPSSTTATFVAYDNCGGASAVNVPITVSGNSGVSVFLPSASSANVPVHIVASAKSYTCANDIDAMRVYVAPGVAPYSVFGNQLDAFLTLSPGTYNLVVQAWDNCGNVLKYPMTVKVTTAPDKFLYATGGVGSNQTSNVDLLELQIANGVLSDPTLVTNFGSSTSSQLYGFNQIIVDPAGYVLYASNSFYIYAFQIDRQNGSLFAAPGSPYEINDPATTSSGFFFALDPNDHFLYVSNEVTNTLSDYQIDPSDGSLQPLYSVSVPFGSPTVNYTGSFVYNTGITSPPAIYGFSIDSNTGAFTPTPGSPYSPEGSNFFLDGEATAWKYFYLGSPTNGYEINPDGSLTEVAGSPFDTNASNTNPLADWQARYFWWSSETITSSGDLAESIVTDYISGSSGALSWSTTTPVYPVLYSVLTEDHSGLYLYGSGLNSDSCTQGSMEGPPAACANVFTSWTIGANGEPVPLSGPVADGYLSSGAGGSGPIATSR